MEWHETHRRQLQLDYRGNYKTFEFNEFADLLETASRLDLTGVRSARIVSRWPPESIISRHSDTYVEVKDAKKLMKKMGLVFRAAKLAPAERKAPEPEKPAAEQKAPEPKKPAAKQKAPEPKKEDGIYAFNRSNALVVYGGVEFTMPISRRNELYLKKSADSEVSKFPLDFTTFKYMGQIASHRLDEQLNPAMICLDAVLEKAESTQSDLVAFSLAEGFRNRGTYFFLKYSDSAGADGETKKAFEGYDVAALREKVKTASLPK